jgi:hypothetical protein
MLWQLINFRRQWGNGNHECEGNNLNKDAGPAFQSYCHDLISLMEICPPLDQGCG